MTWSDIREKIKYNDCMEYDGWCYNQDEEESGEEAIYLVRDAMQ